MNSFTGNIINQLCCNNRKYMLETIVFITRNLDPGRIYSFHDIARKPLIKTILVLTTINKLKITFINIRPNCVGRAREQTR